jgi:hypothetical protein
MLARRFIDDEAQEDDGLVDSNDEESNDEKVMKGHTKRSSSSFENHGNTSKKKKKAIEVTPEKQKLSISHEEEEEDGYGNNDTHLFSLMAPAGTPANNPSTATAYYDKFTAEVYGEYLDGALLAMYVHYKNSSEGAFTMQAVIGYRQHLEFFIQHDIRFISTIAEEKGSNTPKPNQRDGFPTNVFIIPMKGLHDKIGTKEGLVCLLKEMADYLKNWSYSRIKGLHPQGTMNDGGTKYTNYVLGPVPNQTCTPRHKLGDMIIEQDAIGIVESLYNQISGPRMYSTHRLVVEKYFSPPYSMALHERLGFPLSET